jgi:hypothetical protein
MGFEHQAHLVSAAVRPASLATGVPREQVTELEVLRIGDELDFPDGELVLEQAP